MACWVRRGPRRIIIIIIYVVTSGSSPLCSCMLQCVLWLYICVVYSTHKLARWQLVHSIAEQECG
jgi:hypothetical protein